MRRNCVVDGGGRSFPGVSWSRTCCDACNDIVYTVLLQCFGPTPFLRAGLRLASQLCARFIWVKYWKRV